MARNALVATLAATMLVMAAGASAQAPAGEPPAPQVLIPAQPDFLFGPPRSTVGIRAGVVMPREQGELFTFVRDQLTIDKGDFLTPSVTIEGTIRVTPRVAAVWDIDLNRKTVASESRPYIGSDGLPIAQETQFIQSNWSLGLKVALVEPGERISRYAWIPRTIVPYVSAGGGTMYHHFHQEGEFADYLDLSVFRAALDSKGWSPSANFAAGADIHLSRRLYLDVEGKYIVSHGNLQQDFAGFDGIDLNGFRFQSGVHMTF